MKNKRNEGYSTLFFVICVSILLPLAMFFFAELKNVYNVKDQMQDITDNAVSAALLQVDEEMLEDDILVIDQDRAVAVAQKVFQANVKAMGTKLNGTPTLSLTFLPAENGESPAIEGYVESQIAGVLFARFYDSPNIVTKEVRLAPVEELLVLDDTSGYIATAQRITTHPDYEDPNMAPFPMQSDTKLTSPGTAEFVISGVTGNGQVDYTDYEISFGLNSSPAILGRQTGTNPITIGIPEGIKPGTLVYLGGTITFKGGKPSERTKTLEKKVIGTIDGALPNPLELHYR